jgi:hypothetical protein
MRYDSDYDLMIDFTSGTRQELSEMIVNLQYIEGTGYHNLQSSLTASFNNFWTNGNLDLSRVQSIIILTNGALDDNPCDIASRYAATSTKIFCFFYCFFCICTFTPIFRHFMWKYNLCINMESIFSIEYFVLMFMSFYQTSRITFCQFKTLFGINHI